MSNRNPGYNYELVVALALARVFEVDESVVLVEINNRNDHYEIKKFTDQLVNVFDFRKILAHSGQEVTGITLTSQIDDVGPSDCILQIDDCGETVSLGVSTKFKTNVCRNPTGRDFLSAEQIEKLREMLKNFICDYKKQMESLYGNLCFKADGHHTNWYRKKSNLTTDYINIIINLVCDNWNNDNTTIPRERLARRLVHLDVEHGIPYVVIKIDGSREKPFVKLIDNSHGQKMLLNVKNVELKPLLSKSFRPTQYVGFYRVGSAEPFARMQVKFNNGMLEFRNHEVSVGDPISSWNFEFLHI